MKRIVDFRGDEQGSVALWLAGAMGAAIGMGALAVDLGNFYLQETRLQIAADVAALAAARELGNGEQAVRDAAVDYAEKNLPPAAFGTHSPKKPASARSAQFSCGKLASQSY